MNRLILEQLRIWHSAKDRQPLILKGPRQVGKTYILKSFGTSQFRACHYFNLEQDKTLHSIFAGDLKPDKILRDLTFRTGQPIDVEHDFVILDEIQDCPAALTSLKYFSEDMPRLALCAAGSLLGVKLLPESFPVGKVDYLWLGPMTFEEFVEAVGSTQELEALRLWVQEPSAAPTLAHTRLWELLTNYYVTGGMPRVVNKFQSLQQNLPEAYREAREVQVSLIRDFSSDFAKHAGAVNAAHILAVFENVPMQLARHIDGSTSRFTFRDVLPKKKGYAELAGPIDWLTNAGLIHKVKINNRADIPLEAFCKENLFKLYLLDVGILGCMLQIPPEALVAQDYGMVKGFFAENVVAQALIVSDSTKLISWQEGRAELEFLKTIGPHIIPIEVKAGHNTNAKSLKSFMTRYNPALQIKISSKPLHYDQQQKLLHLPLYLAGKVEEVARQVLRNG